MAPKFVKRAVSAFSAALMLAVPASMNMPEKIAEAAGSADSYHDDWLHVNENAEVVDMNGNPVWMTGCNWFGYNVGSQVFDGVWSINMHQAINEIADHGFNFLRVPMSTQILLQWKNKDPDPIIKLNEWKNPELTLEGVEGGTPMYSFDIWNLAVKWCRENGIKIMIDIHSATTNAAGHNYALWYDSNYSEKDWLDALAWFADYYKDDDTILAIDLKNEPHGKRDEGIFAKWDGSSDDNNWRYAAEKGAKACLDQNPNLLIMVEGIEVYPKFDKGFDWNSNSTDYAHYGDPNYEPYYGAWWGGNFRGARDYPVDLGQYQSQLVYSPHDYGPLVYAQSWFHLEGEAPNFTSYKFDRDSLLKEYWYETWAYLVEEKISPLLMGEWGGRIDSENDPSGANRQWMKELRDYMIEKRIHHTFWCFNENSSDTGGLIASDCNWDHWDEEKYEFVKPSLWQTEGGKFISLDHQIPLGAAGNGISLSDYYSGGSSSSNTTSKTTTSSTTTTSSETTTSSSTTSSQTTESTTSTTSSTSTSSTSTSTSTTEPIETTHQTYKFDKVESYPTKTIYLKGEELDLSGMKILATPDKEYTKNFEDYCKILDKDNKSYDVTEFKTLPAGEYTIKLNDSIGSYYGYDLCNDVDVSFKVTIKESDFSSSGSGPISSDVLYGDANCDNNVNVADSVLIMQSLANPAKYGSSGTDENKITEKGKKNADCSSVGDGVTNKDALAIQKYKLNLLTSLPE